MFDDNEENLDEELVPRAYMHKLTMHITVAGKQVQEELELTSAPGLFGNTEPFAKVKMIDPSDGTIMSEGNLPLKDWLGRLVGLLKDTSTTMSANPEAETELQDASGNLIKNRYGDLEDVGLVDSKHKYIFNRNE
tara:strand:+ start:56 stop:460 length:405 start_codon:yes stop_codon:yes gene_type:complete